MKENDEIGQRQPKYSEVGLSSIIKTKLRDELKDMMAVDINRGIENRPEGDISDAAESEGEIDVVE